MKLFEIINPEINKIKLLLKQYNITNYTIRPDGLVDVDGDVNLSEQQFTTIPIVFGTVNGNFWCDNCPQLTTLEHAPQTVNGGFACYNCSQLTTLQGAPQTVNGDFSCFSCPLLTTLQGAPRTVKGDFSCFTCPHLTSLQGAPQTVKGNFYCHNCPQLKILRVFSIKGLRRIDTCDQQLNNIIKKYYQKDGQGNAMLAQDEMIDAGYSKIARL
jgi:hypothetical protein